MPSVMILTLLYYYKYFSKLCIHRLVLFQELFAYGIMNLGGSFFGSIPTAGALSRTVLQDAVGGNTQVSTTVQTRQYIIIISILSYYLYNYVSMLLYHCTYMCVFRLLD